jgi:hypothetical protein
MDLSPTFCNKGESAAMLIAFDKVMYDLRWSPLCGWPGRPEWAALFSVPWYLACAEEIWAGSSDSSTGTQFGGNKSVQERIALIVFVPTLVPAWRGRVFG